LLCFTKTAKAVVSLSSFDVLKWDADERRSRLRAGTRGRMRAGAASRRCTACGTCGGTPAVSSRSRRFRTPAVETIVRTQHKRQKQTARCSFFFFWHSRCTEQPSGGKQSRRRARRRRPRCRSPRTSPPVARRWPPSAWQYWCRRSRRCRSRRPAQPATPPRSSAGARPCHGTELWCTT
jgi:hypothetical protein